MISKFCKLQSLFRVTPEVTAVFSKANDLPAMDLSGYSDPFVKCCLLPDRKRKLETKIRRKNLNPTWNETLFFEGKLPALPIS